MASAERHLQSAEHDDVERTETGRIIRNLIESLPPREREVIHLRDIEGMEITEIAEVTGSTEQSVRMALSRARYRVKEGVIKIMNHGL